MDDGQKGMTAGAIRRWWVIVYSQETELLCLAWYLLLNLQFKGEIYTRLYAFRLGLHTSVDLI